MSSDALLQGLRSSVQTASIGVRCRDRLVSSIGGHRRYCKVLITRQHISLPAVSRMQHCMVVTACQQFNCQRSIRRWHHSQRLAGWRFEVLSAPFKKHQALSSSTCRTLSLTRRLLVYLRSDWWSGVRPNVTVRILSCS